MDSTVRIVGADQAIRALRTMEPETAKQVGREISTVGKDIAAYIRSNAPSAPPMSGWRTVAPARPGKPRSAGGGRGGAGWPAWAPIGASSSRRGTTAIVHTTGPSAAIYESAGKVNNIKSTSGGQFIDNLPALSTTGKRRGRIAAQAIATQYPEAIRRVQVACDKAVEAVNRRMP